MGDTRGGTRSLGHPHRDPPDTPLWPLERVEALGLAQELSLRLSFRPLFAEHPLPGLFVILDFFQTT